ncbi:MAG: amidohydrolase, partial [Candidatus Eremiobacteraeota bacterium]|nr:amidohydrolase [Candidatus Eremiobacteraeota bacterium]
ELGFEETRTAGIIARRLRKIGFEVHTGIATTGVIGVMRGTGQGKTIMLRADMDGLPVQEENTVDYRSSHPGKMHACGHDGHVAILLGAAELIAKRKAELAGTVCVVFQPAEEGRGGAQAMVEEGILERFGIERAYGLHLSSNYDTGVLGFREGPFYASCDSIEIEVLGRGGHGASPHQTIDPIHVSANFVTLLQQIVSRQVDPIDPAVVTIGSFHGGTTHNVIPRNVKMLGTVRAFSTEVREAMPQQIERILQGCCDASGATYHFTYFRGYPVTTNDREQNRFARALASQVVAKESIIEADKLMGAEDFSYFAERVPACFYTLGSRGSRETAAPHHSSAFDIDESALATGVKMMTALALNAPRHAP